MCVCARARIRSHSGDGCVQRRRPENDCEKYKSSDPWRCVAHSGIPIYTAALLNDHKLAKLVGETK